MLCGLPFLCVLAFPLLSALPLPWSTVPPSTGTTNLDLYAQILSDELFCNFDNITYCGLHNNGGWSFKQSLLELVKQLATANALNAYLQPSVQNYFVCSDWGVTGQPSTSSSSLSSLSSSTERVATLELFFPSPLSHSLRQSSAKVFYVEEGYHESDFGIKETTVGEPTEKEINADLGICIEMDVRLSSEHTDGSSKLTVKFRSTSQTVESLPQPPPRPLSLSTPVPSVFGSLASWIFRASSGTTTHPNQAHRKAPPLDVWLHLIVPLDTQHPPESPLYFALDGQAGACVDSLQVTRCPVATIPSISWPPNNTLSLVQSAPPVLLPSPPHVDSTSSFYTTLRHLFIKAFFFASLLIILTTLLVIIFVASVACGRKGRMKRRPSSGKMGRGECSPPIAVEFMRSPSISSLPGAAVYQRPIDEILHCVEEDSLKKWDELGMNSLETGHQLLKRPQQRRRRRHRRPRRTHDVNGRPLTDYRLSPSTTPGQQSTRRGKKPSPLRKQQWRHRRQRRRKPIEGEPTVEVVQRTPGHRLSLLLSINEDNELVLVPPVSSNASTSRNGLRNSSISPSNTMNNSSGAATTTTMSSCVHNTSATTAATLVDASVVTSSGRLSTVEAEATLQEMAASVDHLGSRAETETCGAASPSSSTTTNSNADEPPLYAEAIQLLSEQRWSRHDL